MTGTSKKFPNAPWCFIKPFLDSIFREVTIEFIFTKEHFFYWISDLLALKWKFSVSVVHFLSILFSFNMLWSNYPDTSILCVIFRWFGIQLNPQFMAIDLKYVRPSLNFCGCLCSFVLKKKNLISLTFEELC